MVIVDYGKEDELEVWGYSDNLVKYVMTLTMIVLTVGLLGLVLYWWKQWWLYFTHDACLLEDATSVLVVVSVDLSCKYLYTSVFKLLAGPLQRPAHHVLRHEGPQN